MKILRWLLLGLYILLLIGLFGISYFKELGIEKWHVEFFPFFELKGRLLAVVLVVLVTLISQVLFVFGTGTKDICKPVRKPRFIIPVIITSFFLSFLMLFIVLAFINTFKTDPQFTSSDNNMWIFIVIFWILWTIVFFISYKGINKFEAMRKLINFLLAGSLLELLAVIPSHIIDIKRGGCFVGMFTSVGISAGLMVMLWTFGPGIIFLFLREKHKAEIAAAEKKMKKEQRKKGIKAST